MNAHMFCQCLLLCERLSALIACERLFSSVHPHVALQTIGFSEIEFASVTFVQLLPCMLPHHVVFQVTGITAGKLAHCASVRLLPRVGPFVPL